MRSLLVIIDGLGDDPIPEWNGLTPFQYAEHKNMDELIRFGAYSEVSICEDDFIPESLSCILRLLGVQQQDFPTNRAYLELLTHDRDISEYEMVLRCNLVSVDENDMLVSFNGQGLSAKDMAEAAKACNEFWPGIEFMYLSMYRNLLILDKDRRILDNCVIPPPHESMGENINLLLREIKQQSLLLRHFIEGTAKKLESFNHDGIRYMLYPWGPSERKSLPDFQALHGLKGAAVCEAEIVRGIAKGLQLTAPQIAGATADIDTDIAAKAAVTLKLLNENDFVLTHFNGADEAAHRYDYQGKAEFISAIDKEFLEKIINNVREPLRIVICGDHVTSSRSGKHNKNVGPVIAAQLNTAAIPVKINNYQDILTFLMRASDMRG
ncbi:MAG: hypothetical protein Q4E98_08505 [Acidaminococcaceae bacterium]|nr:hypothetical protein [Acidaminococcaceae bacterium]